MTRVLHVCLAPAVAVPCDLTTGAALLPAAGPSSAHTSTDVHGFDPIRDVMGLLTGPPLVYCLAPWTVCGVGSYTWHCAGGWWSAAVWLVVTATPLGERHIPGLHCTACAAPCYGMGAPWYVPACMYAAYCASGSGSRSHQAVIARGGSAGGGLHAFLPKGSAAGVVVRSWRQVWLGSAKVRPSGSPS